MVDEPRIRGADLRVLDLGGRHRPAGDLAADEERQVEAGVDEPRDDADAGKAARRAEAGPPGPAVPPREIRSAERRLDEAEELIKKALQLKPGNAYIIDSLGWVYFRQNKLERAIELLMEAVRLQPDDVAISEHLGDAYVRNGQFKEALDIYQKTLKLNPDGKTLPGKISDLLKK
ncbi:MAG: tetratricopeptide repeat protein [Chloroflexota bacterium]